MKKYQQQRAQLKDFNQSTGFFFGESSTYLQIGNAHLEFGTTFWKKTVMISMINMLKVKMMNLLG